MNQDRPSFGPLLNELDIAEQRLAEDNDVEGQTRHADEDFEAAEARAAKSRPSFIERLRARLQVRHTES
jgi:hypothetical protein